MVDPLAPLLADGVIDEVVARLKSGKEADLWIVRHRGEAIAAKVYKAREQRSFRNDAVYREGRQVRNTRTQRAMAKGSRFGQAASEESWKVKEADALHALHAAGVRVPTPVMFYEGVLLMELVLGPDGHPAPRLIDAHLPRERAAALYADLRAQVVRMLGCDLIHGDLSPYNVLLGRDGPVVIDFPQVIGAAHNSQAERFFHRDLENLRRFFAALDPALHASAGDAREIWRAYVRRELGPDFVPTGKAAEPPRGAPPGHPRQHREPRDGRGHPQERAHPQERRDRAERARRPAPPHGKPRKDDEPRRDRGARMPEVVRVVRPPLGGPAPQRPHAQPQPKRTHAPQEPGPAHPPPQRHAHAPPKPHRGERAHETPRAAGPKDDPAHTHGQGHGHGAPPAGTGGAGGSRRRRRRRRGPR
jgi:RIO kinase 1